MSVKTLPIPRDTAADVAKFLNVSRASVYGWTRKRIIPFTRLKTGLYRYDREEVAKAMCEKAN